MARNGEQMSRFIAVALTVLAHSEYVLDGGFETEFVLTQTGSGHQQQKRSYIENTPE